AARSMANLSNLRSLGQGMAMYLNDRGSFPPLRLPAGQVHEETGRPRARWHWAIGEYVGRPYSPRTPEEHNDFLNTSDFDRLDNPVFQDPTQDVEDMRSFESGQIQVLRCGSYGYNYQYLGNSRTQGTRFINYPVRDHKVHAAAMTVAFADSGGSQFLRTTEGFREHSYSLDPPRLDLRRNGGATGWGHETGPVVASLRHRRKSTVAFVDGHATFHTLEELGYRVVDPEQWLVEVNAGSNALWNGLGYDDGQTEEP
ncbi:MAG: hypothetical protein D6695_06780, partial [Planctomycetota bacterium]